MKGQTQKTGVQYMSVHVYLVPAKRMPRLPLMQLWIDVVTHYRQLLERVIDQAQRRVLNVENIPASEKIVSLFEPIPTSSRVAGI
jgi:hypothetical protein